MAMNAKIRDRVDEILAQTESEKQWWEKRRGQISSDFMKELDDSEKSSKAPSEDDAVLVDTPSKSGGKKTGKK
jgi:translocation protein SEC66